MEKLINSLLMGINTLIVQFEIISSNELRYRIGEFLVSFYIENKKTIKKQASWNKTLSTVSDSLNKKYGGDGYGLTNLNYMQQFYRKYRNSPEMMEKALKLDWSHNIALLKDKLNEDERNYYLNMAISEKWSVKEIERQIKDESFDNFLNEIQQNNYQFSIQDLRIKNYKSLVNIEIAEPSKLLVFAGANNRNYPFEENSFVIMTREMEAWFLADNNLNFHYVNEPEEILNPSDIVGEQLGTSSHIKITNRLKDRFSLVRASENSRSAKRFLEKLAQITDEN